MEAFTGEPVLSHYIPPGYSNKRSSKFFLLVKVTMIEMSLFELEYHFLH